MPNSKLFSTPFGTSGDKATIPEAVQPSGSISYAQGFGPDYERNPASDPLAKRVPRDETNELNYQVTNALRWLQLYGLPEWYAVDSSGNPVSYAIAARVRHLDQAWASLVATNTATPGSDPTKWALDTVFDLTAYEATAAEALAGLIGTKIITPRRMSSAVQAGAWVYAVAGGTGNALTAVFSPVPASTPDGMVVRVKISAKNTAAATLNTAPIILENGSPLIGGELVVGTIAEFRRNGSNWVLTGSFIAAAKIANTQNLIGNPLFRINQDNFAGGAVAAAAYAIDMWGAPTGVASNMTFANGVATVVSGRMKQVIENPGVALGDVTLSWEGTALGAINGGTLVASPVTFTHTSGNIPIEFGVGTVIRPMLAQGSVAFPFVAPPLALDRLSCYRYYFVNTDQLDQYVPTNLTASQSQALRYYVPYPTTMRIQAAVTLVSYTLIDRASGTPSPRADFAGFTNRIDVVTGSGTAGIANLKFKADARIAL